MRIIYIVILQLIVFAGYCQSYIPLPVLNTHWQMSTWQLFSPGCTCTQDLGLQTSSDTTIHSRIYVKLIETWDNTYCSGCGSWSPGSPFGSYYAGAIRQDSVLKKVYWMRPGDTSEVILYDFTQLAGDTVNSILNNNMCQRSVIQSIDSIQLNTGYHKRFNIVNHSCLSGNIAFIEGVGSTMGLLSSLYNFEQNSQLNCVRQNSLTLYPLGNDTCAAVTGIKEWRSDAYKPGPFPNPSHDGLFTFDNAGVNSALIEIYGCWGNFICSIPMKQNKVVLNLCSQAKGIFFYRIISGNRITGSGKLIIE